MPMPDGPPARSRGRSGWQLVVPVATAMAGGLFVVSAVSSDGTDLRPATTDLASLVKDRAEKVAATRVRVGGLRNQIDALSSGVDSAQVNELRSQASALRRPAGFTAVVGPGVRVTLDDAPREVDVPGLDPNLLVVHQQDIQAFVNALWAGGATAMTLQGQRLISTTGVKCVGNTVVLDGVPYSPPYVIDAVGSPATLTASLDASGAVQTYRQYVDRYRLGLRVTEASALQAPPYAGAVDLTHATALRRSATG